MGQLNIQISNYSNYITVGPAGSKQANGYIFENTISTACTEDNVCLTFVDFLPSNTSDIVVWNFGDGTTVDLPVGQACHKYSKTGTYTITATPYKLYNGVKICMGSTQVRSVTVIGLLNASIEALTMDCDNQYKRIFSCSNCPTSGTFNWDFGDGSSSSSQNPTHTYSQNTSYDCSGNESTLSVTLLYSNGSCNTRLSRKIKKSHAYSN